jgi:hypothetical protein
LLRGNLLSFFAITALCMLELAIPRTQPASICTKNTTIFYLASCIITQTANDYSWVEFVNLQIPGWQLLLWWAQLEFYIVT